MARSKKSITLIDQLTAKQAELADKVEDESFNAEALARAAAEARLSSEEASRHVAAVSAAIEVLTTAGVVL